MDKDTNIGRRAGRHGATLTSSAQRRPVGAGGCRVSAAVLRLAAGGARTWTRFLGPLGVARDTERLA